MSDNDENINLGNYKETLEFQESFYSLKENESSNSINEKVLTDAMHNKTIMGALHSIEFKSEEISISTTPGFCRICLQPDLDKFNRCITPCFCRGSISKVHKLCLETWLAQADSDDCEICKFKFKTKRITKYSLLGSIKAWLFSGERREEVLELLHDASMFLLIAPTMLLLSYSGFSITDFIFNTDTSEFDNMFFYRILSFGICTTIMCLDFFFAFWTSCRIQHHISHWFDFYKGSQRVIILHPKLPEST